MKMFRRLKGVNKYIKIEIAFFFIYFFVFPVLTDIEYRLNEKPCQQCDRPFFDLVIHRLVFGLFQVLPYLFLYKIILHKILLKKKYLLFLVTFIIFLFALDVYVVYVEYWTISQLTFLPASITKDAASWFKIKQLFHFSVIYVINQSLVFAALAYFINYAKQEEKINALKQAKLETDLNYLKAQVQPHFFFNTLNNIYSLAQEQSAATAPLVAKLSDMMRYIIYETTSQKVSLKKEVEFLKNYVDVESVRYGANISINFDTQGIDERTVIEPLLLLPFVENMFKHGIQNETARGFIDIIICLTGKELTMQANNSKPSVKNENNGTAGVGLGNVVKRLKLIYSGKHNLDINDNEDSYEVYLTIHLD